MSNDPVWIIDDDLEDQETVQLVWRELDLPNELVLLSSAREAYDRLEKEARAPFIIICDANLPGENGFELRQRFLDAHQAKFKSVPFIFWSTHASDAQIADAYDMAVHGFFLKDSTLDGFKDTFKIILQYWLKSKIPSKTASG
jgi:DNA-binding NarL/FixJ family response regulator